MGQSRNVNSHPSDKDLTAFANGKLAELRAAVVEQHVARCDRCAATVARSPHDDFIALLSAAERLAFDRYQSRCGSRRPADRDDSRSCAGRSP